MEGLGGGDGRGRIKRRHSDEFKARVVAACEGRGASVAGVSMAHGVNANLVRKWIIKKRRGLVPNHAPGFRLPTAPSQKNLQAASWPYLISLQTLSQFSMGVRLTLRLECSVNAETPPVRRHPAGACVRGQYASPLARRHVRCRNTRASEGQLHRTGVDPTRAGWERWRGALHPRGLHEGTAG